MTGEVRSTVLGRQAASFNPTSPNILRIDREFESTYIKEYSTAVQPKYIIAVFR